MEVADKKYVWDDFSEGLAIVGISEQQDEEIKSRKRKSRQVQQSDVYCPHAYLILNFTEILNPGDKLKFRKCYLRKVSPDEVDVVTVQDIKNVVLFLLTTPISLEFINFFHLEIVDRFLRALILYFEFYTEIWDEEIIKKRAATMKKAPNPMAGGTRMRRAEEMKILRCILARDYCALIVGCQTSAKFHHMLAGTSAAAIQSQGEKDLRIFEVLIGIAHRIVWIALKRKHFTLIEVELHRLLRTDAYNTANRKTKGIVYDGMLEDEYKILHGPRMPSRRKLLRNSPLPYQLISEPCDFRVVSLGIVDFKSNDPRILYLNDALLADEEDLVDVGIPIGILGHSREEYDIALIPLEEEEPIDQEKEEEEEDKWERRRRSSVSERTRKTRVFEKQIFNMPPFSLDPEIPESFPTRLIKSTSTKKDRIRETSRRMWISRELKRQFHTNLDTASVVTASDN